MQTVFSCAILSMLVLHIWCKGQEKNEWSITINSQVTVVPGLGALISFTFTSPEKITCWIKIRAGNDITLNTSSLTLTSDPHYDTVRCDVNYGNGTISTNLSLKEGDTLSLHFTVVVPPPPTEEQEHAGVCICEMTYMNTTLNASIVINLIGATKEVTTNDKRVESMDKDMNTIITDFFRNLDIATILTFVAGIVCSMLIFSVILCCWVCCHRCKKHKVPTANTDVEVNLEPVQNGTSEQTPLHGQLDGETPNTAAPTDGAEENAAVGTEALEADYASIDYSLLKDRPPEEKEGETSNTDYAEIKKDGRGDRNEREALEDGDDQIETPNQKQKEGEDELYSNSQVLKSEEANES